MSSSLQELIDLKKDIEKDFKEEDKIIKILKRLLELKVVAHDIKTSKIGSIIKELKKSKNEDLLKLLKNLISKWKKILNQNAGGDNKHSAQKPKTPSKVEKVVQDEFPEDKLINGESRRNNTRKKLYKNLKDSLKDEDEEKKNELIEKVVEIENTINNKFKGESAYSNRVLEILHNIKENEEFRKKIVNGELDAETLASMDEKDMINKDKRKKIDETIDNKVNSVRSDWEKKHAIFTSGVYKCKKCGGDKTTQTEMQTRSADEPMTVFITCVDCGNSWRI